jgi:hypothetical protein
MGQYDDLGRKQDRNDWQLRVECTDELGLSSRNGVLDLQLVNNGQLAVENLMHDQSLSNLRH